MNKELEQLQQDLINELIQECKEQGVIAEQLTDKSKTIGEKHSYAVGTKHNEEEWKKFNMIIAEPSRKCAIKAFARAFKEFNTGVIIECIDLKIPKEGNKSGNLFFTVDFYKHRIKG